jgi:hypothetical protein
MCHLDGDDIACFEQVYMLLHTFGLRGTARKQCGVPPEAVLGEACDLKRHGLIHAGNERNIARNALFYPQRTLGAGNHAFHKPEIYD